MSVFDFFFPFTLPVKQELHICILFMTIGVVLPEPLTYGGGGAPWLCDPHGVT